MSLSLKNNLFYLNHAGTSWPKPQSVLHAASEATHLSPDQWPGLFRQSLETVARFFHVNASRLVLTPSCTSALNLAILDQIWRPGECVVTSSFEHHALYRNLVKLKSQGIDVFVVPSDSDSLFDLEKLRSKLETGRVRLVAITAACNVTGALLPFEEIIRLAHQYEAKVLLDGAQVAGWMDLNLAELKVDYFAFAGHKGLQAPWGIGGLYVAENSLMNCPTASCEIASGMQKKFDSKPGYCDAGSVDLIALAGLAAGCQWLLHGNNGDRLEKARKLAGEFTQSTRGISGVEIYHDISIEKKMPTVAVSCGKSNLVAAEKLKRAGIIASAGFQCAPLAHQQLGTSENGVIRFSFGPSESNINIDKVIDQLRPAC